MIRADGLRIGDPVKASAVGAGVITGITESGYPQVNHVAVAWLERIDGARFDPHNRYGGTCGPQWFGLQQQVRPWLLECFGAEIAADKEERNHRFLEEALELVQALGCARQAAHELVDYVFDRPTGEPDQEVGGVMTTLAALCLANALDMDEAGEKELGRIWTKVEQIRDKQASKPKNSPLPAAPVKRPGPAQELYVHVKSGVAYVAVCEALRESDQTPMMVYRCITTGKTWARPMSEFVDGRFQRVGGVVVDAPAPARPMDSSMGDARRHGAPADPGCRR